MQDMLMTDKMTIRAPHTTVRWDRRAVEVKLVTRLLPIASVLLGVTCSRSTSSFHLLLFRVDIFQMKRAQQGRLRRALHPRDPEKPAWPRV